MGSLRHRERAPLRLRAACAAALVAAVLLAGCSSTAPPAAGSRASGQPAPGPSASTTANTPPPSTAAPTPATPAYKPATAAGPAQNVPVPVLPAKAKEFSKEGLEAFATYWYSTLTYAYETGDTTPMMAVTDAGCTTCANVKETVIAWHEKGRWIVGGQMKVISAESTFVKTPEDTYQAIVIVKQLEIAFHAQAGTPHKTYPAAVARPDIVVTKYDGHKWTALTAEHLTKE
jgi:hypothetical protein